MGALVTSAPAQRTQHVTVDGGPDGDGRTCGQQACRQPQRGRIGFDRQPPQENLKEFSKARVGGELSDTLLRSGESADLDAATAHFTVIVHSTTGRRGTRTSLRTLPARACPPRMIAHRSAER